MRMQNADMEFVTFDAQDVITTSNTLSINGYHDGVMNNLAFSFDGNTYNTWDGIRNALVTENYSGTFDYTNVGPNDAVDTIVAAVNDDANDTVQDNYVVGNGDYTWDASVYKWIHDSNKSTQ